MLSWCTQLLHYILRYIALERAIITWERACAKTSTKIISAPRENTTLLPALPEFECGLRRECEHPVFTPLSLQYQRQMVCNTSNLPETRQYFQKNTLLWSCPSITAALTNFGCLIPRSRYTMSLLMSTGWQPVET